MAAQRRTACPMTALNTTLMSPKTAVVLSQNLMEWLRMAVGHLQWRVPLLSWWRQPTNLEFPWRHHGQHQDELFIVMHPTSRRPGVTSPPALPHNLQELCENIQAAWAGLSQETIRNLSNSMLRHLACCVSKHDARPHAERHYYCM